MDKSYLDRMIKNIAKNSNANYQAVKQGAYAAKGTFLAWFRVMNNGKYKQKADARKYAKHLCNID